MNHNTSRSGLEVELPLALLIEHAIASSATATHVHPVRRHHDDRSCAEVLGGCGIRPCVPDAANDHVLDFAAVCVQRVVRSGGNLAHLRVFALTGARASCRTGKAPPRRTTIGS